MKDSTQEGCRVKQVEEDSTVESEMKDTVLLPILVLCLVATDCTQLNPSFGPRRALLSSIHSLLCL